MTSKVPSAFGELKKLVRTHHGKGTLGHALSMWANGLGTFEAASRFGVQRGDFYVSRGDGSLNLAQCSPVLLFDDQSMPNRKESTDFTDPPSAAQPQPKKKFSLSIHRFKRLTQIKGCKMAQSRRRSVVFCAKTSVSSVPSRG